MPNSVLIIVRILHVVAGAVWVGAVVVAAFFLMPAVSAAGPAGGQVMRGLLERKYPQVMMALMGLVFLSGLGLMWWASVSFTSEWMRSPMGRMITFGATLAFIGAVFGVFSSRPTAARMEKIMGEVQAAGGPPSAAQAAEMLALQAKMLKSSRIVAVLLLLAAAAMASARYI